MKRFVLMGFLLCFLAFVADAQILDPKKVAKSEGTSRTNNKINQGVDAGFDKVEEGIGSLFKKKKKKKKKEEDAVDKNAEESKTDSNSSNASGNNSEEAPHEDPASKKPAVTWSKFDFVPGDNVIFEDGPSIDEENGEFPSRWDLVKGQIEIAEVDGENVIMFIDGSPQIIPYLENSNEDYLPDVFTVEFDLYKPAGSNRFNVLLFDPKNQDYMPNSEIDISHNYIDISENRGTYPGDLSNDVGRWIHFSLAYTKGKLKMYMDDTRLINIPHFENNPTGIALQAYWADSEHLFFIKNVRIAEGGVKYYDRVLNDGKIVCNGIRFDVNKASLKPESMGPINKIYELMAKKPDLNFSIEGHTDADGDADFNQKLSEERAQTVFNTLVELGIAPERLKVAGYGESNPIAENTTAEGKANNRRVEFVKF